MNFNQSIPLLQRPKYAEGSKLISDRDDRNNAFLWKKGDLNTGQISSLAQAVQKLSREVGKQRRRIVGGGTGTVGVQWQSPNKELDPRVAVSVNTWVYISALNPLVTVGIIDADSGLLVTALPGKWLTLQDVPALIPGGTYHMPQLPYPGATGEVTGTPLAGDLDNNPLVYWFLESPAPVCFS
jgi:hypothetical protein